MGEDSFKSLEEPDTPDIMDGDRAVAGPMEPIRLRSNDEDNGETIAFEIKDPILQKAVESGEITKELYLQLDQALTNNDMARYNKLLKMIKSRNTSRSLNDWK